MSKRCTICSKKLPIISLKCKCTLEFCSVHRLPEYHNCTYDYKREGVIQLTKTLVACNSKKVDKI